MLRLVDSSLMDNTNATMVASEAEGHYSVLFGGVTSLLVLLAFALLILACSYWKTIGYLDQNLNASVDLAMQNEISGKISGDQESHAD